jgi:hypothetical protein
MLFNFTFEEFLAFDRAGEDVTSFDRAYSCRGTGEDVVTSLEFEKFGDVTDDGFKGIDHEAAVTLLYSIAIQFHFKFDGRSIGK